jgi:deazaflavin-dependent oxidoreductase (nitroreductase family)
MVLVVVGTFVFGLRAKSPSVRNAVRHFNRAVSNPLQMRSAGAPGAYASIIKHRGRTSGKAYETPVDAVPTDDGFVIATVYGSGTDWLKNVLASGSATIVRDGRSFRVADPRIVPMTEARYLFPEKEQRAHRRFRIDRCVLLRRIDLPTAQRVPEAVAHAR